MERLNRLSNYASWFEPLHTSAMEQSGLDDFGDDLSYQHGLRVLLESMDQRSDLTDAGIYATAYRFVHLLKQRLLAEREFRERPALLAN